MIVETMTDEEITRQLEKDMPEVEAKTMAREREFRRMVVKSTSYPFSANPFTVTTANRNRWIVIFRAMARKERKQINYAHTTFICTATFSKGVYAFINPRMITEGSREVKLMVYQPHFFARFRERLGIRKSGMGLVADYFLKNYSYYYGLQDENAGIAEWSNTRVYGTSQQGIGLGIIKSESRTLFNTFITYEMMHQAQFSTFTQNEILRQRKIALYQSCSRDGRALQNSSIKVALDFQEEAVFGDAVQKAIIFTKAFMSNAIACNLAPDIQAFVDGLTRWMLSSIEDSVQGISEKDHLKLKNFLNDVGAYFKKKLAGTGFDQWQMKIPDDEETERLISTVSKEMAKAEAGHPPLLSENNVVDYSTEGALPMLQSIINAGIMQSIMMKR